MSDEYHEHDGEGNCLPPGVPGMESQEPPAPTDFSSWEMLGIAATTLSGFAQSLAAGLNMFAQGCWGHAKWKRNVLEQQYEAEYEAQQRAEMAEAYERMVGMDTYWLETEADRIVGDDG